jgi:FAD/FMN-containing dehydrogenase
MEATATAADLDLGSAFTGDPIAPGHPEYDEARRVFNAMIDRRPEVIARCRTPRDVMAAVRYARERDVSLAVRGGGHGVVGFAVCDGGLVLDVSPMKRIEVDAGGRTVRAGAGVLWGELDRATQAFGLATTGGRISTTGIAGLTLGSGSGWLERKHGFSADNLLAAEIVTADGELVRADREENPELFWALRGGGGNFGVVTALEYRLHPVGPVVLGGLMLFAPETGRELTRHWSDFMQAAPDEVGGALVGVTAPAAEFIPAPLRGRPAFGIVAAYFGSIERGREALRPLREQIAPAVDLVAPLPYVALQQLLDPMNPPGRQQYWKSDNLPALGDAAIEVWVEHCLRPSSRFTQVVLEPRSGACARVDEHATPLRRDAAFNAAIFTSWEDPDDSERQVAWTREFAAALEPHTISGAVLNYTSDTGDERVRSTFGAEKYARLVAAKRRWDPENVFRLNQNIRPWNG